MFEYLQMTVALLLKLLQVSAEQRALPSFNSTMARWFRSLLNTVVVDHLGVTWVMPCLRQGSRSLLIQGR